MNTDGDLTPTPQPDPGEGIPPVAPVVAPPAPRSWVFRHRRLLIPAAAVLALSDPPLAKRLDQWRVRQTAAVGKRPKD